MAVSVSASQLIKLIKSVTSLVLKKVTAIVCVFFEKKLISVPYELREGVFMNKTIFHSEKLHGVESLKTNGLPG